MAMKFEAKAIQGLVGPSTLITLTDDEQEGSMMEIKADRRGVCCFADTEGTPLFFSDPHDFQILAQAIGAAATAYQKKHKVKLTNAAGH